jgi:RNA polymerase sigma factor (sigma-70 family)
MKPDSTFDGFCQTEFPRLVGSIWLFCGDREIAEELAQETLMRAYRDWGRVHRLDSPGAWAHKVGLNLARSYFRRKAAEQRARQRQTTPSLWEQDPTEVIALRAAVAVLPSRQKTALLLRYYADLPVHEVAEEMGCSTSTVKALIRKATNAIRHDGDDPSIRGVPNVT